MTQTDATQNPSRRHGATPAPSLRFDHLLAAFRSAVSEAGDEPAMFYFDRSITYMQLDEQSDRLALWMIDGGVSVSDRVLLSLQNVPQFVMMAVAAWKVGAIPVPANPMYTTVELSRLVADAEPAVILCFDHQFSEIHDAIQLAGSDCTVLTTSPYSFQTLNDERVLPPQRGVVGAERLEDVLHAAQAKPLPVQSTDPDNLGLILYTSGTTGVPKGAMLRHASLAYNAQVFGDWCALGPQTRILAIAPFFHITGFVCHMAAAFCAKGAQVLHYRVEPSLVLDMIRRHRPTFSIGAITVFNALSSLPTITHGDMSCFDRIYSGGAPIPPSLLDRIEQRLGVKIHSSFGMTEVCAPTHLAPYMERIPVDPVSGALSIGVLEPGTRARIVDDQGQEVETGKAGELLLAGPQVMSGYWRKPVESAEALSGGWMHTGDVAFVDENGWYYLIDRKKDVIIASGFKVWPREVEDALYAFEGVREAAVVGVADSYRGESVKAFISLKAGQTVIIADLLAHCRERLAGYKVPREIEILDELPKTATGKVQRLALRSA